MERTLARAGVAVTTLTTDDDGPGRRFAKAPQSPDSGVERVYCRKWTEFYKTSPGLVVWLMRNVHRYDVVHIHALFSFSSVAAALVAYLRGVPYVVRPLGTLSRYGMTMRRRGLKELSFSLIESRILRHAAAVHCTSRLEQEEAEALGVAMHAVIVPLGIEAAWPASHAGTSGQSATRAASTILYLSRLDPKKNLEGLLHAMAELRTCHPDLILEVAGSGDGAYVQRLKQLARDIGVFERVRWLGHVEGEDKVAAFERADIFVLPSHSENFGIAPVEALLAGLPCVLGRGVAIADDVERAGAGVAVDVTPTAIATAVASMLENEAERVRMGANARRIAIGEYSLATMGRRLVDLYAQIARSEKVAYA